MIWRRLGVAVLAAALALSGSPARADQHEGFDEFSAGLWYGSGVAGGTTLAREQGGRITGNGQFTATLEFLVPVDGATTGSWVLDGSSTFLMEFEGATATLNWATHSAEGPITGDRKTLTLGATQVRSAGDMVIPGFGSQPVSATDPLGPIELRVAGRMCNDAWGTWIMSWNTILEGEGFTPTFDGDWYAVRQPDEASGDYMNEIMAETGRIIGRVTDFLDDAESVGNVSVIPEDIAWDLAYAAVEQFNVLKNLSRCDRALLGDQVQHYGYVLSSNIGALFGNMIVQTRAEGLRLSGETLLVMATMSASVGAIGEGSVSEYAERLEDLFEDQLDQILTDPDATDDEIAAALVAAEQMGWDFDDEAAGE